MTLDLNSVTDVLEFEARWEGRRGPKNSEIRERFGVAPARYHQKLAAHLQTPAALEHDPALTHRLIEQRDRRTAARTNRTFRL